MLPGMEISNTTDVAAPSGEPLSFSIPLYGREPGVTYGPGTVIVGFALVDREDYLEYGSYRWHLANTGYAARKVNKGNKAFLLHREIMGLKHGDKRQVDHINGNRLDNRRENLRLADHSTQHQNLAPRKGGTSIYRGVGYHELTKKWRARVQVNNVIATAMCETEEEANRTAIELRRLLMPFAVERDA